MTELVRTDDPAGDPAPPAAQHTARLPQVGRAPAVVWLATAAMGLLLVLWSVAVPAYRAPDEPQHLSTALRLASGGGYPHPGSGRLLPEVAASYPWANFPGGDHRTFVPSRQVEQPQKGWPSFATLAAGPVPPDQVDQVDQMTQHPPLWTLLAAAEIDVFHLRHVPADTALLVLRLLQALLLLPLPWLTWRAARLLGAPQRAAASVTFLPLLSPQLMHVGASITDGDLLLLEMSVTTVLLIRMALGDLRRRVTAGIAVAITATLLTKAFGLVLLPAALVALLTLRRAVGLRALRGPALVTMVAPALLGGWWYALRYVQEGSVQPSGYPPQIEAQFAGHLPLWTSSKEFLAMLLRTSWSDLGWFETPPSLRIVIPVAVAVALPVTWVVLRHRVERRLATVALAPFALLVAFVLAGGLRTWRHQHAVYGAQGRYLFPAAVGVAAVLAVAIGAPRSDRVQRALALVLPVGCLLTAVLGLNLAVHHFWSAVPDGALHAVLAASPLPGWFLALVGLGAVAALTAALAVLGAGPRPRRTAGT